MAVSSWVSSNTAQNMIVFLHFSSPLVLISVFLIAFTWYSVATASKDVPHQGPLGPGGKPLPTNKTSTARSEAKKQRVDFTPSKKILFIVLSVALILTFLANAGLILTHVLADRKDKWWCGQHVAVSEGPLNVFPTSIDPFLSRST